MKNDDADLIQRILAGEQEAFTILVQKYQKSVHSFVWRKIGDFHTAEEITQDVFLSVYKKLQTLKAPERFAGWLYIIAIRKCFAWFKKKRIPMKSLDAMPLEELEELAYAEYHAEKQTEAVSERHRELVKRLLQKLPEGERTVVTLHYLGDMSCEDIGTFLSISSNTVKSRLHRARKRLQKEEPLVREILGGSKGVIDMPEKLKDIQNKFDAFMAQVKSDSQSGADILTEVFNEVEEVLKGEITPELVHLADDIYSYKGKPGVERCIALHRRYLTIAPDDAERFWSHSQLMIYLALLGRNPETIEEQTRLYHWACEHLSDEYVLETLANTTPANCWKAEGRIDEWFQLYNEACVRAENPEVSLDKRCVFLRTGAEVLLYNDRLDEALVEIEKLERINQDPSWKYYRRYWLGVITTRLRVHSDREDWSRFEQVLAAAQAFLDEEVTKQNTGHSVHIGDLTWVAHDVGACLMWAKKYNAAKRFLQVAIDFGSDGCTHFFFAISVWAADSNREKTLHHLKAAQDSAIFSWNPEYYHQYFLETPEFSDVWEDKAFLKVFGAEDRQH